VVRSVTGSEYAPANHSGISRDVVSVSIPASARSATALRTGAQWLLSDPDVNGVNSFAYAFQKQNGALKPNERLIPSQFCTLGGSY
jgi:secreted protein with Ig-like and vWFA domain